jgi:hypothetical protein
MDMMLDTVQEEVENSIRIRDGYRKAIAKLPRGSLSRKKIDGNEYYYLVYWGSPGKVKTKYLGKLSEAQVKKYQEKIKKRREYKKLLRDAEEHIKFYQKVLKYGRKS